MKASHQKTEPEDQSPKQITQASERLDTSPKSPKSKEIKETESHIKVFIRKRPLLPSEFGKNDLISVPNQVFLILY